MTEEQLKKVWVGECLEAADRRWPSKKALYKREKIWKLYVAYDSYFIGDCEDSETGWIDNVKKRELTQKKLDDYLFAKARGENVELLDPFATVEPEGMVDEPIDLSGIEVNDAPVEWAKAMTWIYRNMDNENVKLEDAPSSGEYSHLMRLQKDATAKNDFYKTVVPRLFPSKTQLDNENKFHDDGRTIIDLIKRLQGEREKDSTV